jgi:acyl-CoA dehydrogenase
MQHLAWPFFDDSHRALAPEVRAWAERSLHDHHDESRDAVDKACRRLVADLGAAGFTRRCVPRAYGGTSEDFDARAICRRLRQVERSRHSRYRSPMRVRT